MSLHGGISEQWARPLILGLDERLRRVEGIYAFSQEPECMFRISRGISHQERVLSDGTKVGVGDPLIELHWWNEHIAHLAPVSNLSGGVRFYRHTYRSLLLLARYVECTPELRPIVALQGETIVPNAVSCQRHAGAFRKLGFELVICPPAHCVRERVSYTLQCFHVWALRWASNPASLRCKDCGPPVRCEWWISRQRLLEQYKRPEMRHQERSERVMAPSVGDATAQPFCLERSVPVG